MFHYFLILWDSLWLKGECVSCLDLLCVSALTSGARWRLAFGPQVV